MKAHRYRRILAIATDIIPKLPHRGDGLLSLVIKFLSIVDSFDKVIRGEGRVPSLYGYFSAMDLESKRNHTFVDSFFGTPLHTHFSVKRVQVAEVLFIIEATHPELGSLYFVEWCWGGIPEVSSEFWFTKGFNFEGTLQLLWSIFGNKIHIGLRFNDKQGRVEVQYSDVVPPTDSFLGSAAGQLEKLIQQHHIYLNDEVPRTYLFWGMQGVGKSTMALSFANAWNRTLRIDARGLTTVGAQELDFLINSLQPAFLIVDDLDRASELSAVLPTLFGILTDFKGKHSRVTIVLTCNNLDVLDVALRRPGRIDVKVKFSPPGDEDRAEILQGYLSQFGIKSGKSLTRLVRGSKGLTASYLRELALQMRYKPIKEVLALAKEMQDELAPKEEKKDPSQPTNVPISNLKK